MKTHLQVLQTSLNRRPLVLVLFAQRQQVGWWEQEVVVVEEVEEEEEEGVVQVRRQRQWKSS